MKPKVMLVTIMLTMPVQGDQFGDYHASRADSWNHGVNDSDTLPTFQVFRSRREIVLDYKGTYPHADLKNPYDLNFVCKEDALYFSKRAVDAGVPIPDYPWKFIVTVNGKPQVSSVNPRGVYCFL